MNMFSFLDDMGNYDDRKVARDTVGTLIVSTAFTSDEGYETAIIDARGDVHPVERYPLREDCVAGHAKWVEFCRDEKNTTICKLGGLGGLVGNSIITLVR